MAKIKGKLFEIDVSARAIELLHFISYDWIIFFITHTQEIIEVNIPLT